MGEMTCWADAEIGGETACWTGDELTMLSCKKGCLFSLSPLFSGQGVKKAC